MDLQHLFEPRSIAVIGASTKPGNVGNDIVKNLTASFAGEVYPVNPKATELYGRKCYPTIADIEGGVDVAVIVVPALSVGQVAREAVKKGVKGIVVISAGFKETGRKDLEEEILGICRDADIPLIGPNCLGVINAHNRMNASFAPILPEPGRVAFLSQSGALCSSVLDLARSLGIGFSKFVSMGNRALADEADMLDFLADDPQTDVVAMYAEELRRPQELMRVVRKMATLAKPKPVVILKAGVTTAGASAASSHTGSLAGSDAAYDALFEQSGMIRVRSVSDLFDTLQIFLSNGLPAGNRLSIITNAGGPGVLCADEAIMSGLEIAKISEETQAALRAFLPAAASVKNPIDILGDARSDRYAQALEVVSKEEGSDMSVVVLTPQSMTDVAGVARAVADFKAKCDKPLAVSFMGGQSVRDALDFFHKEGVGENVFPQQAVRSLAALYRFSLMIRPTSDGPSPIKQGDAQMAGELLDACSQRGESAIPEVRALAILEAYGFQVAKSAVCADLRSAQQFLDVNEGAYAMKIVSPDILHKSDVGGVELHVTRQTVGQQYERMMRSIAEKAPQAKVEGVLLAPMAPKEGVEVILGSTRDPHLGTLLMVGLGGIYVEIFKDVSFGLVPVTREDSYRMVRNLKSHKILEGARGGSRADIEALEETILRLSQFLVDFPHIKELDMNPLLVLPEGKGVLVLDARIIL